MGMWQIPRRHRRTYKQRNLPNSQMPSRRLPHLEDFPGGGNLLRGQARDNLDAPRLARAGENANAGPYIGSSKDAQVHAHP